jgi:hypothetical protein
MGDLKRFFQHVSNGFNSQLCLAAFSNKGNIIEGNSKEICLSKYV